MDEVFSCLVTKNGDVYYDNRIHSHELLLEKFINKDLCLQKDYLDQPAFVEVKITPNNHNILFPDKWVLKVSGGFDIPDWFLKYHEDRAWEAHAAWLQWLHSEIDIERFPQNPFLVKPDVSKIQFSWWGSAAGILERAYADEPIESSVWDFSRDFVSDALWNSVWFFPGYFVFDAVMSFYRPKNCSPDFPENALSIGMLVRNVAWSSAAASLRDFLWAQVGYMLPNSAFLEKDGCYKYQYYVDLWQAGIVPVYWYKEWHHFGSPNASGNIVELQQ